MRKACCWERGGARSGQKWPRAKSQQEGTSWTFSGKTKGIGKGPQFKNVGGIGAITCLNWTALEGGKNDTKPDKKAERRPTRLTMSPKFRSHSKEGGAIS